jgi:Ca2+/Na+ antiporter
MVIAPLDPTPPRRSRWALACYRAFLQWRDALIVGSFSTNYWTFRARSGTIGSMPLDSNRVWTAAMLLLAAVGLYGGCRAVLDVLTPGGPSGGSAGRRAVGQCVPIAAVALAAMAAHQAALAVVILFSTSVALLTLVLGLATVFAHGPRPDGQRNVPASPGRTRRTWMLVLPAALLVLVAGLRSQLAWPAATAIAILGIAILAAWREANQPGWKHAKDDGAHYAPAVAGLRALQVILGLAVCGVGAWMMLKAAVAVGDQTERLGPGTFAAVVLCPLLVLPVLGTAVSAAQHGAEIVTPLVGTVLLNICLLLPVCVAVSYATWQSAVPFPPGVWRLENMLLVVVGLFLVVAAMRWWALRRAEGMLLVAGYFAYLLLLMAHSATTLG